MAIDTASRRGSSFLDDCGILFAPSGSIGAPERLWLLGQYDGIAAGGSGGVSTGTPERTFTAIARGQVFTAPNRGQTYSPGRN